LLQGVHNSSQGIVDLLQGNGEGMFGKSITTKFVAILVLILLVGQGIGTFFYLRYIRSNLTNSQHLRMDLTVKQASRFVAEPILNYNFPVIDSYLSESLQDKDIASITLIDKNGKVIREKEAADVTGEQFVIKHPIMVYEDEIGSVILTYTKNSINASMRDSMFIIPLYQAALLIIVSLVLVRLFTTSIKRPVEEINKAITHILAGDLTASVPILGSDEIGSIASGVRFLVERLQTTVNRINSISIDVSTAMLQLNQTFDRVVMAVSNQQFSIDDVSLAIREATEGQKQVLAIGEQLMAISSDNASALLEMSATSEEIAANADNLNKNIHNSYSTLTELTQSARQVALMANQVSATVEEASASVEEIYQSVRHVEEIVKNSANISRKTSSIISEKGMDAIADATESMRGIESFIDALTSAINRLDLRSKDIEKILMVIEDVTEKTRLLSFNAQIIAAQAGEYGKGFAVVANQMKELSDRTALSTKEIESIVSAIQNEIGIVVTETKETVKVVRDSNEVVSKTGEVLREIRDASEQAADMAKSIERASLEQTKGLELVVTATEQIKTRIFEVTKATTEQEKSTSFLLKNITPIKDAMENTRRATEEHAESTRLISSNIELANQKIIDVSSASTQQQRINERTILAMDGVVRLGKEAVKEVKTIAPFVLSLREELDTLKKEIEVFRTSKQKGELPPASSSLSTGLIKS
jgi:methyl-accepting chemotaxis protein